MTAGDFERKYMAGLNAQQKNAVSADSGNTLLLAVPGSGKTTVLVYRLGYLLLVRGAKPESLLTVTYTRAATIEMKKRFADLFGEQFAERMEWRTINGISAVIVNWYIKNISRRKPFRLQDNEGELNSLVLELAKKYCREAPTDSTVKDIRTGITYCKNMLLTEKEIENRKWEPSAFPVIFSEYNALLREKSLMDYDDQMVYALRILQNQREVREHFRGLYRHISVDEAQDTSRIQHEIIRVLAEGSESLFMVGDEDQSIYGFRAAWPEALLHFEQNYAPARVLKMEENYRSGKRIVDLAQRFVEKNTDRYPKTLRAFRSEKAKVQIISVKRREDQYKYLLKQARGCKVSTAVLYRNNDSALPLIDLLERGGIPYSCRAQDVTFFSHRVVTDVCDILRFALDETDGELFLRFYYKLGRYISKNAAQTAAQNARLSGTNVLDELEKLEDAPDYLVSAAQELKQQFALLRREKGKNIIERVWHSLDYGSFVEERQLDKEKYPILLLLSEGTKGPESFLARLEELRALINNHQNSSGAPFCLSTVHSAKGLEFDRVFLLDIHDGVLPSVTASEADSGEEEAAAQEERRLFYVAMTRAKNELNFFECQDRSSSFIREIKPLMEENSGKPAHAKNTGPARAKNTGPAHAKKTQAIPAAGETLNHRIYGKGTVQFFNGTTAVIRFTDGSVRGVLWQNEVEKGLISKK